MNGANRLGGNSLSDLLVFGKRAGEGAARFAAGTQAPAADDAQVAGAADEMLGYLSGSEDPYAILADLQQTLQDQVGIFRDEEGLTKAMADLRGLWQRARNAGVPAGGRAFNPAWNLCRDLRNMLTCAEAITRAALMREESRGAHSRLDFPETDEYWGEHNIVLHRTAHGMHAAPAPVRTVAELLPLVEARKAAERR
jgi:succinate dehydrogenase / fumarate reductase flavoprotein subunit